MNSKYYLGFLACSLIVVVFFSVFIVLIPMKSNIVGPTERNVAIAFERDACEQYHRQAINAAAESLKSGGNSGAQASAQRNPSRSACCTAIASQTQKKQNCNSMPHSA